jgi:hypothetical protein
VGVHACNSSIWEVEAEGFWDPRLYSDTVRPYLTKREKGKRKKEQ